MEFNRSELIGKLSDGTPILGMIDAVFPGSPTGVVSAETDDWYLTAQNDPDLVYIQGENVQLEELTIEQLNALRALLATDIPEQMIAAAVAYGQRPAAAPDERRQIAREADRVLAKTFAETAQHPECQAAYAALSPNAKRVADMLTALIDRVPAPAVERTLDSVLADAVIARIQERIPARSGAKQEAPAPPTFVDDDPRVTVIDDGERSGVQLERYDRPAGDRAWLDFTIGDATPARVLISIDIVGGHRGMDLLIAGREINHEEEGTWTLADVRQLHADLGKLLADPRLAGALAEQHED